ncbi:glycogenin-1 [Plakobranchus ocellatus]|uniref:glycogenin glucosyltransferase n=1 Tax=Plakobranchus ocellatus TaxID=259542 RepID=A0AAV4DU60_9GAST|nr:glycogenin-1 [Plakobranchus ocellatus]
MAESKVPDEAFVTLATNDTYALGCLVLGSSLQRVSTTRQLVVMITSGVSASMRQQLEALFDQTVEVNILDSSDTCNLELLGRPDLSCTFTKFHCWRLTQFKKCVFMDADTLVLQNIDDLFDREELSAAPDAGWPDCFNSGVFVFVPSEETYRSLLAFAVTSGSFDGGDQGLLNSYFKGWATEDISKHLPFTYNVVSQAFYSYLPAFKQFRNNVKVVHFIGAVKPWHQPFNTATGQVTALPDTGHSQEFLQIWWNIFMESVQPNIDPTLWAGVQSRHKPPSQSSEHDDVSTHSQHDYPHHNNYHQNHHDHHSHHDQHQQQNAPHGHSETRGKPTTTLDVVYPYIPPNLGDEDSQNHPGEGSDPPPGHTSEVEASSQPQVKNVPVVYRDYQVLETHYSEPPLSSVDPEVPPSEHYGARESLQGPAFQPSADADSDSGIGSSGEISELTNQNNDSHSRPSPNQEDEATISQVDEQAKKGGCDETDSSKDSVGAETLNESDTDENANPTPKVKRFHAHSK